MTRPSDTEAVTHPATGTLVTLLFEHRYTYGDYGDRWTICRCGFQPPEPPRNASKEHRTHLARVIAAALAGAGAQVTEAAVEAAAEAIWNTLHLNLRPWAEASEAARRAQLMEARTALSAALPHMGTGQAEALAKAWDNGVDTAGQYAEQPWVVDDECKPLNPYRPAADSPTLEET